MMYYYRRKTNKLKWFIVILVLLAVGVFGYWFYVNYFSKIEVFKPVTEPVIQPTEKNVEQFDFNIKFIEGTVEVDSDQKGFMPAVVAGILKTGDKIKTAQDSKAIIETSKGAVIRLNGETEIRFLDLAGKIVIMQTKGRSYFNLISQSDFQLQNLQTVVTSLGGKFEIFSNDELETLSVLDFSQDQKVEVVDTQGLIWGVRLSANEKVALDLTKAKKDQIKVDTFKTELLAKDAWYKWNFDLDEGKDAVAAAEPDFTVAEDSLKLQIEQKDKSANLVWTVYNAVDYAGYKIVKSAINNDLKYPEDDLLKEFTEINTNKYLDAKVEPGVKYYYRVCVEKINKKVVCGNIANFIIPKDEQPPVKPSLSLAISVQGVALNWTANTEEDFKDYKILKSFAKSELAYPGDKIATVKNGQSNYLDNQVNITSVGKYYYQVCSFDHDDNMACSDIKMVEDGQVK